MSGLTTPLSLRDISPAEGRLSRQESHRRVFDLVDRRHPQLSIPYVEYTAYRAGKEIDFAGTGDKTCKGLTVQP